MNLLLNGLNAIEKDAPGGWGGRPFHPDMQTYVDPFSNDTSKNKDLVISAASLDRMSGDANEKVMFPNLFPAAQNDFAVRMDWSVTPSYRASNHHPVVTIKGIRDIVVKPGESVQLEANVSDPDGNRTQLKWWQFIRSNREPIVAISNITSSRTYISIPREIQSPVDLFIVLEVYDDGKPSLTRYQRIRFRIRP